MTQKWFAVAATALLASCTAASGSSPVPAQRASFSTGQCFRGDDVNNFNVKDRHTLYVSTNRGRVYRLVTAAECFRTGSIGVSVSRFRRGDPGICLGDEAVVRVMRWRGGTAIPCLAQVSGPVTDSSVSGLRARQD